MKKIHPYTTFALLFNLISLPCMLWNYPAASSLLALLGFFFTLREVSHYTSSYQFIMVIVSALMLGASIDIPNQHFPLTMVALFFAAAGAVVRIAFFRIFSYTSFAWFEPLCFVLCLVLYLLSNLGFNHDWKGFLFPAPLVVFAGVFAWGTLKDKNQLLRQSRGGYRVQTGKEAHEFELPDQEGNLVKLSDYRGQRHLLLIFVRGDWCPGCHMMLRTYEKNNEKFKSRNILVMAIGPDPVGVNRGMVEKLGLDFKVLSDEGQKTAMVYGVQLKEYDNAFAEKYEEGIPLPASFLIDKNGIVRYVSRPDKVGEFLNPSLIFPVVEQLN